eukprot:EG_transcript_5863
MSGECWHFDVLFRQLVLHPTAPGPCDARYEVHWRTEDPQLPHGQFPPVDQAESPILDFTSHVLFDCPVTDATKHVLVQFNVVVFVGDRPAVLLEELVFDMLACVPSQAPVKARVEGTHCSAVFFAGVRRPEEPEPNVGKWSLCPVADKPLVIDVPNGPRRLSDVFEDVQYPELRSLPLTHPPPYKWAGTSHRNGHVSPARRRGSEDVQMAGRHHPGASPTRTSESPHRQPSPNPSPNPSPSPSPGPSPRLPPQSSPAAPRPHVSPGVDRPPRARRPVRSADSPLEPRPCTPTTPLVQRSSPSRPHAMEDEIHRPAWISELHLSIPDRASQPASPRHSPGSPRLPLGSPTSSGGRRCRPPESSASSRRGSCELQLSRHSSRGSIAGPNSHEAPLSPQACRSRPSSEAGRQPVGSGKPPHSPPQASPQGSPARQSSATPLSGAPPRRQRHTSSGASSRRPSRDSHLVAHHPATAGEAKSRPCDCVVS